MNVVQVQATIGSVTTATSAIGKVVRKPGPVPSIGIGSSPLGFEKFTLPLLDAICGKKILLVSIGSTYEEHYHGSCTAGCAK